MEENKPKLNKKDLENNINIFLNKEVTNDKLITKMYQDFLAKGLPSNTPKLLFENDKDVNSLSQDELIAFCISANDFFKNSQETRKDEDYVKLINPSLYFYHKLISENNMLKPNEEDKMETIIFHGVQMLKENELQTKLTAKELNRLEKTGNLVYLKDVQRATKIQKLPNGEVREVENYNKEGLKDLQQRFLNKDLLITQITLSIIVYDGKTPEIEFVPYSKDHPEYGDFIFKPCYDINSNHYAFLSKTDGAHREGALVSAFEKDDNVGDEMLSVAIKIVSLPIAKQFISDTFKVNETDATHKKALANTPINNYINTIVENSVFKGKLAVTKGEEKLDNIMYGSYTLIKETLEKFLNIKLKGNSSMMANIEAKSVARKIDTIVNGLCEMLDKSKEQLKKETVYLNKQMCMIYIMLGYKFKDSTDETIYNIITLLIEKRKELENICKLKSHKNMFEQFNELIVNEVKQQC